MAEDAAQSGAGVRDGRIYTERQELRRIGLWLLPRRMSCCPRLVTMSEHAADRTSAVENASGGSSNTITVASHEYFDHTPRKKASCAMKVRNRSAPTDSDALSGAKATISWNKPLNLG